MKNKKAYNKALKHILCCLILLLIFVITIERVDAKNKTDLLCNESEDILPLKPYEKITFFELKEKDCIEKNNLNKIKIIEKDINFYITTEINTLSFFAKAFGFDIEFVKEDLIKRSEGIKRIEPTNIGSIKDDNNELKKFDSIEYGIVEYYYDISSSYPEKQNKHVVPYNGDSEYIEKLIMYYTTIYTDVDKTVALSIGAAESGYYRVKYMLNMNNVYGGMSTSGLIRYNNIEIGVLKYIRLLSNGYYKKGLTSIESIGKVYCPTFNENGEKIASQHWINLVTKAKNKYINYTQNITLKDILEY